MAVRKFKPTTPGQRHKIIGTFEEITASGTRKVSCLWQEIIWWS